MTTNLRPGPEISSLYALGSAIYLFDKTCHFCSKPGTKHFVPVACKRLQKFHTGLSSSRSHENTYYLCRSMLVVFTLFKGRNRLEILTKTQRFTFRNGNDKSRIGGESELES